MGNRAPKSTKVELESRLREVEQALCDGVRYSQIVSDLQTKYGISYDNAKQYITRVYARWKEESKEDRASHKAAQIERIFTLYNKLSEIRDEKIEIGSYDRDGKIVYSDQRVPAIREQTNLEKLLAKIQGTEHPTEIGGPDGGPIKVIIEDYTSKK